MNRIINCIFFWMLLGLAAMAQEKKTFTLEDLIPGGRTNHQFYPENLSGLKWKGETVSYYDVANSRLWFRVPDANLAKDDVLLLEGINKSLEDAGLKKVATLSNVLFPDENKLLIRGSNYYAIWEADKIVWQMNVESPRANDDFCISNNKLSYTIGNNLWIADEKKKTAITDEPEGVVCGQSVHRNEFGISKGTFWSPKGNYLAFYRMDERMVTDYPLVDISTRVAQLHTIKYPMAGMTSHLVTVGVYDVATGEIIYLNTGDPTDRYFTNIAWSPDEKAIYVIELNREQNHSQLVRYNPQNGEREKVLIEEKHDKYIEPEHPIVFVREDSKQFIYQSQQDGYNHLYLYNTEGKQIRQLTSGSWIVQNLLGFDEKGKHAFFLSTEKNPLESQLYKVNLKNGKRTLLTEAAGVHQVILSPSGKYAIDHYSSADVPRKIAIIDTSDGRVIKTLLEAANPYSDYDMPVIECGTIKAADEATDLYYRLVKPVNFDPQKKYPTIIYVYGGPHAQMVRNTFNWNVRGWDIYMAQKGYVVFSLDNRGSMNRGLEFENVIYRQLGTEEGKDQMRGVEFLKSLPFVDENRLGLHGWSFGGHMTIGLLLRNPGVFKVGVAGGPVVDWQYYEVMYGERYMSTPQLNPDGYAKSNLNKSAGNLKDKLLVIHDDSDETCVLQHTLSFMKACVEAFTFPDLFIYPGHGHNVRGHDRVHLYEKVTRYFDENL